MYIEPSIILKYFQPIIKHDLSNYTGKIRCTIVDNREYLSILVYVNILVDIKYNNNLHNMLLLKVE